MEKISKIENNIDEYLNIDNLFEIIYVYDGQSSEKMIGTGKTPDSILELYIKDPYIYICRRSRKNSVVRIKLLTNEYFREKDDRMNTLSASERKELNKYFNQNLSFINFTKWQNIMAMWNEYNPRHIVDFTKIPQPDYTIIYEPK